MRTVGIPVLQTQYDVYLYSRGYTLREIPFCRHSNGLSTDPSLMFIISEWSYPYVLFVYPTSSGSKGGLLWVSSYSTVRVGYRFSGPVLLHTHSCLSLLVIREYGCGSWWLRLTAFHQFTVTWHTSRFKSSRTWLSPLFRALLASYLSSSPPDSRTRQTLFDPLPISPSTLHSFFIKSYLPGPSFLSLSLDDCHSLQSIVTWSAPIYQALSSSL
jgi:hypothetical protein